MRSKIAILLAIAVAAPFPAVAQDPAPETLDQLAPEIDALFAKYRTDQHIPGMVYGVVKDGKLAYVKGIGVHYMANRSYDPPYPREGYASMAKGISEN